MRLTMPCYHPLTAYRGRKADSVTGFGIVFDRRHAFPPGQEPLQLPCNQCVGCRLDRARKWAIRCVHEAQMHDRNCFITLTYDKDKVDPAMSLNKRDFPLFMKRLRKKFGPDIRFFHCAEYGEKFQRPHHHAILFNIDFDDREIYKINRHSGIHLFTSLQLAELWTHGFCTVGDVTFDSACYVARYIMKKRNGRRAEEHYQGREPEYTTMSRRPGIGHDWLMKYNTDIYNYDKCVVRDNFIIKPPRYYDNIYDKIDSVKLKNFKEMRVAKAKQNKDNTPERLAVRERSQILKSDRLKRSYEENCL